MNNPADGEEFEYIKVDGIFCWIRLRYHSEESIAGWAFRIGGHPIGISSTEPVYGYLSRNEARIAAIAHIEEALKQRIQEAQVRINSLTKLLTKVKVHQKQVATGDRP